MHAEVAPGQELEPRALTSVPVGMNFLLAGYSFAQGNILLDPGIPIDDLNANLHTFVGAYVRSIKVFGLSGKADVVVPIAFGDWSGYLDGTDTTRSANGMGDIRFRISVNFLGAPALKKEDFPGYKPSNISGLSLQVITPTGKYDPDRLINLGSNRWVFRPQWGFAKYFDRWIVETYLAAWLFTVNKDFFGGDELKQNPLGTVKLHLIRSFPKGWWVAMDTGYGLGGRTFINGAKRDTRISSFRLGLNFAFLLAQYHTIRITGVTGVRLERGPDFDAIALTYQYRWIKTEKKIQMSNPLN
jgi:hypothetical protein